ncbi:MAG: hypothetical protein J0L75_02635 [Spirochaetes bacterium]|nr:hypothetical protein [Spirochaetota bacterium]
MKKRSPHSPYLLLLLLPFLFSGYIQDRRYDAASFRSQMEYGRSLRDETAFRSQQSQVMNQAASEWEARDLAALISEGREKYRLVNGEATDAGAQAQIEQEARTLVSSWEAQLTADLQEEYGAFRARESEGPGASAITDAIAAIKGAILGKSGEADAIQGSDVEGDLSAWRAIVDGPADDAVARAKAALKARYDGVKASTDLTGGALGAYLSAMERREASDALALEQAGAWVRERAFNAYAWKRRSAQALRGGISVGGTVFSTNGDLFSGESPDKIALGAASGMAADLGRGLEGILSDMGYRLNAVGDAQIDITSLKDDYQKRVAETINRGLLQWGEAEDRLSKAYAAWNTQNNAQYMAGAEQWRQAVETFEAQKTAWVNLITSQVETGRQLWDRALSTLQTQQNAALDELGNLDGARRESFENYWGTLSQDLSTAARIDAYLASTRAGYVNLIKDACYNRTLNSTYFATLQGDFGVTGSVPPKTAMVLTPTFLDLEFSMTKANPSLNLVVPGTYVTMRWVGGAWRHQTIYYDQYTITPVEATVGIAYDEARNGFTYSVDYAYDYQQYYEDQSRDLWIAPHWTDAQRFHQGGSRALTSDPGIQAKYGISYENLYYYQGQIALLDSLRSRASGVLSRALSENQNLLYGSGNEEGLFTDNGNPQDLYFRTADEWEVRRLTQELAQAREREDRKRAVIQAVSNRFWDAAQLALAESSWTSARDDFQAKQAAYQTARSNADAAREGSLGSLMAQMGAVGSNLAALQKRFSEVSSNFMDASVKLSSRLMGIPEFQVVEAQFNQAKADLDGTNAAMDALRSQYHGAIAGWMSSLVVADDAYRAMEAAESVLRRREDIFDTLKYVDYVDGDRLLAEYQAAQAARAALETAILAVQNRMAGETPFILTASYSGLADLKAKIEKLARIEKQKGEMGSWQPGTFLPAEMSSILNRYVAPTAGLQDLACTVTTNIGPFRTEETAHYLDPAIVRQGEGSADSPWKGWTNADGLWDLLERKMRGESVEAAFARSAVLTNGGFTWVRVEDKDLESDVVTQYWEQRTWQGASVTNVYNPAQGLDAALSAFLGSFTLDYGSYFERLRVARTLGVSVAASSADFRTALSSAVTSARAEEEAALASLDGAVSGALAAGVHNQRQVEKARLDALNECLTTARSVYQAGEAFALVYGEMGKVIPRLVFQNQAQEVTNQMAALDLKIAAVMEERDHWEALIQDVQTGGMAAWSASEAHLIGAMNEWDAQYQEKTYLAKLSWKARNEQLNAHKILWVQSAQKNLVASQQDAFLRELETQAEELMGRTLQDLPGPVEVDGALLKTKEQVLSRMESLSRLRLSAALAERASVVNVALANTEIGKMVFTANEALHKEIMGVAAEADDLAKRLQIAQAYEAMEASRRAREEGINGMDEGTAESVDGMLSGAGFSRKDGKWYRRAAVDATLWGSKDQDQYVNAYLRHEKVRLPARYGLKELLAMGTDVAEYLVKAFGEEITLAWETWMGKSDQYENGKPKDSIYTAAQMFSHVGRAPEFTADSSQDPMTVTLAGVGQMGDIMTMFRAAQIAKGRGDEALRTPVWKKKMWDDTDPDGKKDPAKLAAPSLASVVTIVVSVALTATGVGAVASGAILAGMSAADTIATGAYYGKSAGEIALDTAKGLAVAGVGMLTAGIGSAMTTGLSTVANVATQAGFGAIRGLVNSGASAVVNAVQLNSSGQLTFNTTSAYWNNAGASMLSGSLMGAAAGAASCLGGNAKIAGTESGMVKNIIGFQTGSSALNGFLNGVTRGVLTTAANYGIQNGVAALEQHWNTGSFDGYKATKFSWGSGLADVLGEGVGAGISAAGGSDFLSQLGTMGARKVAYLAGNTAQHFLSGGSSDEFMRMKGIDLIGGLSASFGMRNQNTGAFSQIFGLSLTGDGLEASWGPSFKKSDMTFAAELGLTQAQRMLAEERERKKEEDEDSRGTAGVLPKTRKIRENEEPDVERGSEPEDTDPVRQKEISDNMRADMDEVLVGTSRSDLSQILRNMTGGKELSEMNDQEKIAYESVMNRVDELDRMHNITEGIKNGEEVGSEDMDFLERNALAQHDRQLDAAVTDALDKLKNPATSNADRIKEWKKLNPEAQRVLQTVLEGSGAPNQRINQTEEWDRRMPWYADPVNGVDAWDSTLRQRTADRTCNLTTLGAQLQQAGIQNPTTTQTYADYLDSVIRGDAALSSKASPADRQAARESDENRVELAKRMGAVLTFLDPRSPTTPAEAKQVFDSRVSAGVSFALSFRDNHWVNYAGHDANGVYVNNPLGYYEPGVGYRPSTINSRTANYGFFNFYTWQQAIDLKIGLGPNGKVSIIR